MKIILTLKNHAAGGKFGKIFFQNLLKKAATVAKINENFEIGINLVGQTRIRELNKKYRGKNKATNVLSFPLDAEFFKKTGVRPLGDIFICLPIAKKEAKEENISVEKKLAWLTVHGFLHLLGYDHEKSEKDAKKMFVLEKKILKEIN